MAGSIRSKAFGIILRERRDAVGMTREELALAAERDRKFIWLLEKGQRQPSLDTIFELARALRLAPAEMVASTESLTSPSSPTREPCSQPASALVSAGEATCPGCEATYTLQVRSFPTRVRRKFKCPFCEREIGEWKGAITLVYRALRPPKSWVEGQAE
jgi:transcriptional regulator with XRE-family HTH domain